MVQGHSPSALFWRVASTLDLATRLSATPVGDLISVTMCEIDGWERGCQPVSCKDGKRLPIIRMTIDSLGIKKVERLSKDQLQYSPKRFDNMVFVNEHETSFTGVIAQFQVLTLVP